MRPMSRFKQFLPDTFTIALLSTVALATFLPGRGLVAEIVEFLAQAAVCLLFFLHGARLPRAAVVEGISHWRLHLAVFALSFVVFPLLGFAVQQAVAPI